MLLAAERKLHDAPAEFARSDTRLFVSDDDAVDAQPAALDLPPRLAVGADKAGARESAEDAEAGRKFRLGDLDGRQALGERAFLEGAPRPFGRGRRGLRAMQERRRLIGEDLLGFVDLGAAKPLEPL